MMDFLDQTISFWANLNNIYIMIEFDLSYSNQNLSLNKTSQV